MRVKEVYCNASSRRRARNGSEGGHDWDSGKDWAERSGFHDEHDGNGCAGGCILCLRQVCSVARDDGREY